MSAKHILRFEQYPNRGIDLPYQPRRHRKLWESRFDEPVSCRLHGIPWTECESCSPRGAKP